MIRSELSLFGRWTRSRDTPWQRNTLDRLADMERPRKKINIAYAQRAGLTDAKSRMKRQHYGKADFL